MAFTEIHGVYYSCRCVCDMESWRVQSIRYMLRSGSSRRVGKWVLALLKVGPGPVVVVGNQSRWLLLEQGQLFQDGLDLSARVGQYGLCLRAGLGIVRGNDKQARHTHTHTRAL